VAARRQWDAIILPKMLYKVYQSLAGILSQALSLYLEVTHTGSCASLSLRIGDSGTAAAAAARYAGTPMAHWTLYKAIALTGSATNMPTTIALSAGGDLGSAGDPLSPFTRLDLRSGREQVVPDGQDRPWSSRTLASIGLTRIYNRARFTTFAKLQSPELGRMDPVDSHGVR
jgi:hypothetical protein